MHANGRKEGTTVCRAEELTLRLRKGSLESVDNEDYLRFCTLEVPRQCKRERANEWFSTILGFCFKSEPYFLVENNRPGDHQQGGI